MFYGCILLFNPLSHPITHLMSRVLSPESPWSESLSAPQQLLHRDPILVLDGGLIIKSMAAQCLRRETGPFALPPDVRIQQGCTQYSL